ncbi:lactate/malate family dehydrogenase [Streptomyces millisiae]|uniref:Lactate dehydrogenase n=1 Tax=Streptomyces millisiae TaxID=3075542 RepID=A0ABU2LQH2_9ACTN|nr:NAD(P)-binding domain-containing protein [Streptomyces sp. DSM 44918]MDT0319288.1 lactate dehydrogenase [Streptomyces sp. DSM 44918]
MTDMPAIGVLGAGAVGQAIAGALVTSRFCGELLIASRTIDQAAALADDLDDMRLTLGSPTRPRACRSTDLAGCHALVIAARARFTNHHRADVRMGGAVANGALIRALAQDVVADCPGSVLVVTNPVDLMARLLAETSGHRHVYGVGSSLDTARYRLLLARHLGVPADQIAGHVIGEHGDAAVLCTTTTTVTGAPLPAPLPLADIRAALTRRPDQIRAGIGRTRTGPAGAVLAALRHVLGRGGHDLIELSRPWRDGVWLGLPISFAEHEPCVRMPRLSAAEAHQLDAAVAKLAAAYQPLAHLNPIGEPL